MCLFASAGARQNSWRGKRNFKSPDAEKKVETACPWPLKSKVIQCGAPGGRELFGFPSGGGTNKIYGELEGSGGVGVGWGKCRA